MVAELFGALWPETSVDENERELVRLFEGPVSTLPLTVLVAEGPTGELLGFVEVGLRSHADGCDPAHAVGFIEGWFVREAVRGCGIGRRLLAAAEDWSRGHRCIEMGSDALLDNEASHRAHEALGYAAVNAVVNYRKTL